MAEKGEESPTAMRLRTALGPERENQHFIIIGLGRFGSSVAEDMTFLQSTRMQKESVI
jgi:hypothetical protein